MLFNSQPGFLPPFAMMEQAFTRYIRRPDEEALPPNMEERRMRVYAELFYNNVQNVLASTFPVLRKILGDEGWHALIRDYFTRHAAQTPLFPQMPREFLAYLEKERGVRDTDPPFLGELAHYEWVELALAIDPREISGEEIDPDGDLLQGCPVLSPLAWPLAYRFPVHRISPDEQPAEAPPEPTYLVVYRDRSDAMGFLALNPVSARLLELLSEEEKRSGEQLLRIIAEELQHPDFETVKQGGLAVMQDLRAREVLLGVWQAP